MMYSAGFTNGGISYPQRRKYGIESSLNPLYKTDPRERSTMLSKSCHMSDLGACMDIITVNPFWASSFSTLMTCRAVAASSPIEHDCLVRAGATEPGLYSQRVPVVGSSQSRISALLSNCMPILVLRLSPPLQPLRCSPPSLVSAHAVRCSLCSKL